MRQIGIKLMVENRIGRVKVAINVVPPMHFTNGKTAEWYN